MMAAGEESIDRIIPKAQRNVHSGGGGGGMYVERAVSQACTSPVGPSAEGEETAATTTTGGVHQGGPGNGHGNPSSSAAAKSDFLFLPAFVFLELKTFLPSEDRFGRALFAGQNTVQALDEAAVEASDRFQMALNVLDHTPILETLKVGVVYVMHGQSSEQEILSNRGGSMVYLRFIQSLGSFVPLTDCSAVEYTGGLDRSGLDGAYAVRYDDELTQIIYHVATMIEPAGHETATPAGLFLARKRHIGNDGVKIVFTEQGSYDMETISGDFNFVTIVVHPINSQGSLYRVQVKAKEGIPRFGPVMSAKVVSVTALPDVLRALVLHASVAVTSCPGLLPGGGQPVSNRHERLRQIKDIAARFGIEGRRGQELAAQELTRSRSTRSVSTT